MNGLDVVIGRNLGRARSALRWSTDRLAGELGVSPMELAQTEAGLRRLLPLEMCLACRALNLTVAELYAGLDDVEP